MFILLTVPLIFVILALEGKFYEKFSSVIFVVSLLSLAGLFVFGSTIKGQTNWYSFGSFGLQPSDFAKAATALALAKYLSYVQINLKEVARQMQSLGIILLPIILIVPHDPGSALIFTSLILVLYREGLPGWYVWTGFIAIFLFFLALILEAYVIIGLVLVIIVLVHLRSRIANRNIVASALAFVMASVFVLSVDYVFDNVFKQHHRDRFNILLGKEVDMKGIGYN